MSNKKPILDKLRKRYSIYEKIDGKVHYTDLPDNINRSSFPLLLYDFGKDEILTIDKWQDMYDLSLRC